MAGIAALGAAVGGFSKGYMEGEKHRSDMEDAEARRGLVKLQTEEAQLKLNKAKRDEEYEAGRQKLFEDIDAEERSGKSTPSVVANPSAEAAPAPRMGLSGPGGAPAEAPQAPAAPSADSGVRPGSVPPSANLSRMEKIITRMQDYDLKHGKIDPVQALEGMKKFRMYQQEGVIDGLRYFEQTGDSAGAIQRINATGRQQMPEGTRFEVKEEEAIPGSGVKVKNVYAISPDGKASLNYRDLLRSSLTPQQALSLDNETGVQLATLAWRKQSDERLREIQLAQLDAQKAHWGALEAQQRENTRINLERLGIEKDKYRADKIQTTLGKAYGQAMDMVGFVKLSEEKLGNLSPEQLADYKKKLLQGNAVYSVYEQNFNLKEGTAGITMGEAKNALIFADRNPDKIQATKEGAHFVTLGGKQYFVPAPNTPAKNEPQQGATTAQPAPAPSATPRAGLKAPSIVDIETREIETGRRAQYSPEAQAEIAKMDEARKQANAQALAAEQQRQLSASRGIAAQYR